jgi:hypothetical protein
MDDYQETRLHEPDPSPAKMRWLNKRRMLSWVLYFVVALAVMAALYFGFGTAPQV